MIVPDSDLVQGVSGSGYSDPGHMEKALEKVIKWLITYIMRVVSTRKTDMYYKRPGSVTIAEPKFIWVKMLPRDKLDKAEFFRDKFNSILESELVTKKHSYIMDLSKILYPGAFNHTGTMTTEARDWYRMEMNMQIQLFDKLKLELKPLVTSSVKQIAKSHVRSAVSTARRQLPEPPRMHLHSRSSASETTYHKDQDRRDHSQFHTQSVFHRTHRSSYYH